MERDHHVLQHAAVERGREVGTRIIQLASIAVAAALVACLRSEGPRGFSVRYGIGVFGCGASCETAGPENLTAAARGDTVWVRHDVILVQALEPTAYGQVRPACGENATVLTSTGTPIVSLPPATCPDSLEVRDFVIDSTITRSDQWVIDSSLAPAAYAVVGQVLQRPKLQPYIVFTIQ